MAAGILGLRLLLGTDTWTCMNERQGYVGQSRNPEKEEWMYSVE